MAYKLLFVCLGNICRSPSAENIMNHLVEKQGLSDKIICDSAGTSSYHIGASPDSRMSAAAYNKLGFKLRGEARQFQVSDFKEFDLILAMDEDNYHQIIKLDRYGEYDDKVRLMCDFCTKFTLKEVPDPYYGGTEGFHQVIDLLMDACSGLLEYVKQKYL
ncbi:low molecular weight phosphotyrosine protein phosphatase [Anabaena sp. FACHB-1237]|uniref:low molecular weight protein-tyrosine-phosphatase n=1 Tax=Anabaena sp. FACHB-1237 TaxID=2692769 RepID=UPI00168012FE|nr:low molecular weight protein-tyrosine-phosphatase [Anabaena sp. FACHB-1237]MBD2138810.1 low molecular weight phosphotyrosine protein phosphatase [Anabaena sp. FACHB-1237]